MNEVIEMLSYPFMQRAFVLGILVAVSAALLEFPLYRALARLSVR